jgi:4-hydroxy-tetrahydrodipicolinate reductase
MAENSVVNVMVAGAAGRIGQMICQAVNDHPNMRLVGAFEHPDSEMVGKSISSVINIPDNQVPISIEGGFAQAFPDAAVAIPDVVIDFTAPDATRELILSVATYNDYGSTKRPLAMVIGTTGLPEQTLAMLQGFHNVIPCVQDANMSIGINVLTNLVKKATTMLGSEYDAEIVEMHHNKKKDAPSGTAIKLAKAAAEGLNLNFDKCAVYERRGEIIRGKEEIGIQTLRGGDVAGEHTIYLAGNGERVELIHRASSPKVFIDGAIKAAFWVTGETNGLYSMADVIG